MSDAMAIRQDNAPEPTGPTPMRTVSLTPPFDKLVGRIAPGALAVPSMMSTQERRFLYGIAERYYSGQGLIVDAGLFLGASTRCFGEGVKANREGRAAMAKFGKPVVSFERALVNPGMPAFFKRNGITFTGEVGDSFDGLLRTNVAPVGDYVDLRIGDILETGRVDQPIEILYLDVLKSAEITQFCYRNYFERLIPGQSLVLQQDYFFDGLPFIKTYQEHFAHHFEYVGEICSMAVFKCVSKIPPMPDLALESSLDADAQLRLSSIAMHRTIDPVRRFMMAVSKLRLIRKLRGLQAARAYLEHIVSDYPHIVDMTGTHSRVREIWDEAQRVTSDKKPKAAKQPAD